MERPDIASPGVPGWMQMRRLALPALLGIAAAGLLAWAALGVGSRSRDLAVAAGRSAERSPRPAAQAPLERLKVRVKTTYPHDPHAFTQGLLWYQGKLWESTGQYGSSQLRQVDLESGRVLRQVSLPSSLFGEGLARVGEELVQLSWKEEVALRWDLATFERRGEHHYSGEGWGLCHDGEQLVMSDGSDVLTFRDAKTFDILGQVPVTVGGRPLGSLNELECVDGQVWANVWTSDRLVRIDPASGRATAVVDASGLLTADEARSVDVLNGIAYRPESGTFLITGKLWPKLFEVEMVPEGR